MYEIWFGAYKMQFNTKYLYELGKHETKRRFSFTTPPKVGPDVPYTFGVIGQYLACYLLQIVRNFFDPFTHFRYLIL